MDNTDNRLPRYLRLRDTIAAHIAGRMWRPGEAIPTEAELAATHGVAIGTVRKAIDLLVTEGLVERQQGRGTFVRRPSFDGSLFRFLRFQGPRGERIIPQSRILERQSFPGPEAVTRALRLPGGAAVIRLLRLRLVEGRPVLCEEIWLPEERFAAVLTIALDALGPLLYPIYEERCGEAVASAEETLTVDAAGPADNRLLGVAAGEPVVVIERLAFGYDGRPLEWRQSRAPGTTFRYQIEIR